MSDGMDNKLKNLTYEEAYTYYERTDEKDFLHLMLLQGQKNVSEVKKHYGKGIIQVFLFCTFHTFLQLFVAKMRQKGAYFALFTKLDDKKAGLDSNIK